MIKLAEWQHALVSLLILIALLALVYSSAIIPLQNYHSELSDQLTQKQDNLTRFQSIAAQKSTLIPFYQTELKKQRSQAHLMAPMSSSLAAAKLQEQVKQILQSSSGQLLSTQALPTQAEGIFSPVKIRVHMKSDLQTLLNTVHKLESGQPLGFIENLQIQVTGRQRNQRKSSNAAGTKLDTRFDLKVYMQDKQ